MSCSRMLEFVRNKCNSCFRTTNNPKQISRIQQPLIEMEEVKQASKKQTILESSVVNTVDPKQPLISVENSQERKRENRKISIAKQLEEDLGILNQEQFHSIESSMNIQTERSFMSSKVLITHLDKLKKNKPLSKKKESNLYHSYNSSQWDQTPSLQKININEQMDNFKDWLKLQYGKSKVVSFRINHAVRLRMQGTAMFTLLMHKLQDFKVDYMNESSHQINHSFNNQSNTLTCQFHNDKVNSSNYNKSKIISYFFIKCNVDSIAQLLSVFTSKQAFRIIHGFVGSQAVEYQGENLKIPFPIIQVRYNYRNVKESGAYHLVTQVTELGYPRQQFREMVQIGYSLDECEQGWQRVLKIKFSFLSEVEIYCESFESIGTSEQIFFFERFSSVKKYLIKLNMIPAN